VDRPQVAALRPVSFLPEGFPKRREKPFSVPQVRGFLEVALLNRLLARALDPVAEDVARLKRPLGLAVPAEVLNIVEADARAERP
jgi:hypothetical protein